MSKMIDSKMLSVPESVDNTFVVTIWWKNGRENGNNCIKQHLELIDLLKVGWIYVMLPTVLQQWHIPRHCLAFPNKNIANIVHNNVFFWTCCVANSMEDHTVFLICVFCANHLMKNPFVAIHINPFWVSQISQQHQCTYLCLCDMWVNSSQCSVFFSSIKS